MIAARVILIKLMIRHERNPRQRMPVSVISDVKRPGKAPWSQAGSDKGVPIHVNVIVIIDEAVLEDRHVDRERHHQKQEAYQHHLFALVYGLGRGIFSDSSLVNSGCGLPPFFRHNSTSFHAWE